MKISCNMAEDLLPLYLEDACSDDSKAALQEHLASCPACRDKCRRMRSSDSVQDIQQKNAELLTFAKKVKKHRIRSVILGVCVNFFAVFLLMLVHLASQDIYRVANPNIYEVEEGTYNLTAANLETVAEDVDQYLLYTDNTKIAVTVVSEEDFHGTVKLYDAEKPEKFIMIGDVTQDEDTITFTMLSSSRRYLVSCEGVDGASVIVTDGRMASFWGSLKNVLAELL